MECTVESSGDSVFSRDVNQMKVRFAVAIPEPAPAIRKVAVAAA